MKKASSTADINFERDSGETKMFKVIEKPEPWLCKVEILVREGSLTDRAFGCKARTNGHEAPHDEMKRREALEARQDIPRILRGILQNVSSHCITRSHPEEVSFALAGTAGPSAMAVEYQIEARLTPGAMDELTQLVPPVFCEGEDSSPLPDASRPDIFGVCVRQLRRMKQ